MSFYMRVKQAASHPKEKKVDYTVTSSILQMENAMYSVTIIIIIIFINCNWVVTRWQWLYYMYTNMERKKK